MLGTYVYALDNIVANQRVQVHRASTRPYRDASVNITKE